MQDNLYNRRALLGLAALTTGTMALGQPLSSVGEYLATLQGEARVEAILNQHFPETVGQAAFLKAFHQRLLHAATHPMQKAAFERRLVAEDIENYLEIQVLAGFVIHSNYYDLVEGRAAKLALV